MAYWIYIKKPRRVGVHSDDCHYYKRALEKYGYDPKEWDGNWCGPFSTTQIALKAAGETGKKVHICRCFPKTVGRP